MSGNQDEDRERRHRRTLSLIVRTTYATCFVAGVLLAIALSLLKLYGVESYTQSPQQYTVSNSWGSIVAQVTAVSLLLPSLLSANFWLVTRPSASRWFQWLGALILFGCLPAAIAVALFRYFTR